MENLTEKEITEKGKTYDNVQNEGGSGYNPYWAELDRRDCVQAKKDAERPKTKAEQVAALYDRVRVECGSVAKEWGDKDVEKKQAELYVKIDQLEKEIEAEFCEEWTKEVTASRRIEWNNFINNKKETNNTVSFPALAKKEKELGWTMADLKKAVKIYN